ncbi:MAG TPA: hypothetical protein VE861_01840 [Gemmatimonadaceae bacterium]|nr:hypothetical protein [Gemmatimonadaceae bacterium]
MRHAWLVAVEVLLLAGATACYRLPLRIRENDASGYEDIGVPIIEAVEYTPAGRDLRVALDAPGYVTVILVDPAKGATVRFRRGELQSRFAAKGTHRYPLDRLTSPMSAAQYQSARTTSTPAPVGTAVMRTRPLRMTVFDANPVEAPPGDSAPTTVRLSSRALQSGGAITATHVVVLVSERPLDLVGVAMRLARTGTDPLLAAQAAADVIEGGRWMAAMAPLRGQ